MTNGWTAFGDSYAAGLGANGFKSACGQGLNAHPRYLDNVNFGFAPIRKHKFSFLACSNAVMKDVMEDQLPAFKSSDSGFKDSATISIGGNDVDFVGILKACVFKTWLAGDCDKKLDEAQARIDNIVPKLASVYTHILEAAVDGGAPPHFTLFATGKPHLTIPQRYLWPEVNIGMQVMPSSSTAPPRSATMSVLTCFGSQGPSSQESCGAG